MSMVDLLVAGAGPAGLAAACLAGEAGARVAVVAPEADRADPRTVAIMAPALDTLATLGIRPEDLGAAAAPLKTLRIVDDTGGLIRAPELAFSAREIGLEAFGWNIPLAALVPALRTAAHARGIAMIDASVSGLEVTDDHALANHGGEATAARLIIAADGHASPLRRLAGVRAEEWHYDQAAIATSFDHSHPHRDTSIEFHRDGGPFTTVPLPGARSSLVWMERPARAELLMAMSERDFAAEIQVAAHGALGLVGPIGPRRLFAMRGLMADRLIAPRMILLGEAAHSQPPIGAQGLNMSIADAGAAARLIARALTAGGDPGEEARLQAYEAERLPDIRLRQGAIGFMNSALLARSHGFDAARMLALESLAAIAPLRRYAMRRGLGP